ncbi:hypothetical protein MTO96_042589, partial [Rhipicephalus appendiculatus]
MQTTEKAWRLADDKRDRRRREGKQRAPPNGGVPKWPLHGVVLQDRSGPKSLRR